MDTQEYIIKKWNIDPTQRSVEIPNITRETLAKLFAELGFKIGVEIGTYKGEYAEVLCQNNPDLKLYCVDPWKAYEGKNTTFTDQGLADACYQETVKCLAPYNATLVRKFSLDAVNDFALDSLDFVFLDGNHEFRQVVDDISEWEARVRHGGIISGHDYIEPRNRNHYIQVVPAIHGYCNAYDIRPLLIVGRKFTKDLGEIRDRNRSWFYVKK